MLRVVPDAAGEGRVPEIDEIHGEVFRLSAKRKGQSAESGVDQDHWTLDIAHGSFP
jgi:hypothetical protein